MLDDPLDYALAVFIIIIGIIIFHDISFRIEIRRLRDASLGGYLAIERQGRLGRCIEADRGRRMRNVGLFSLLVLASSLSACVDDDRTIAVGQCKYDELRMSRAETENDKEMLFAACMQAKGYFSTSTHTKCRLRNTQDNSYCWLPLSDFDTSRLKFELWWRGI